MATVYFSLAMEAFSQSMEYSQYLISWNPHEQLLQVPPCLHTDTREHMTHTCRDEKQSLLFIQQLITVRLCSVIIPPNWHNSFFCSFHNFIEAL